MNDKEEESANRVVYRLQKADKALQTANSLIGVDAITSVNRAYYAMFYAANALAENRGYHGKTHKGLIRWFDLEFVASGLMGQELGAGFRNAFDDRQNSDYMDYSELSEEAIEILLEDAAYFIEAIKQLVTTTT